MDATFNKNNTIATRKMANLLTTGPQMEKFPQTP